MYETTSFASQLDTPIFTPRNSSTHLYRNIVEGAKGRERAAGNVQRVAHRVRPRKTARALNNRDVYTAPYGGGGKGV